MTQISNEVLLALIGVFTGMVGLMTLLVRVLLKVTKQNQLAQESLTEAYKSQGMQLLNVLTENSGVMKDMKVSIDQNTKVTEKSVEVLDRFKDFVTSRVIDSTH